METKQIEFFAIPNFEGCYEISKCGIVKSIERVIADGRLIKERILKQSKSTNYLQVCLSKDGKAKQFFVHQLLARTFISDYNTKTHRVDHRDQNTLNNNLDNLHIVTNRENSMNMKNQSIFGAGCKIEGSRFTAQIQINGKIIYLGMFDTSDEANTKYLKTKELIENIDGDFYFKRVKTDKTEYSIEIFKK